MATRAELRAERVVRLLAEARKVLETIYVQERAVDEARDLAKALETAEQAAYDFQVQNAPYTPEEEAE